MINRLKMNALSNYCAKKNINGNSSKLLVISFKSTFFYNF